MRAPEKKKAYRRAIKKMAREGFINDADGRMIQRGSMKDNSMIRDYYPQRG